MRRLPLNRLLLALGLLLATAPAFAAMQAKPVEWKVGKQSFSGYLVYDDELWHQAGKGTERILWTLPEELSPASP